MIRLRFDTGDASGLDALRIERTEDEHPS